MFLVMVVDWGMMIVIETQVDKLGRPADVERQPDDGHNSNPRLFHLSCPNSLTSLVKGYIIIYR